MGSSDVSIYDVAKKAGVSIATVSRVINGSDKVKDIKRKSVEDAIKELNYVPSESARRLAGNTSGMIGLSLPFEAMEGSYISGFLKGAVKRLENTSYSIVLINDHNFDKTDEEPMYIGYIQKKSIDALLMAVVTNDVDNEILKTALEKGFPLTYAGELLPEFGKYSNVYTVNNKRSDFIYYALCQFYLKGHKTITVFNFDGKQHEKHFYNAVNKFRENFGDNLNINLFKVDLNSFEQISQFQLEEITVSIIDSKSTGYFALSMRQCKIIKDALAMKSLNVPNDISAFSVTWDEEMILDPDFNINSVKFSIYNLGYYGMDTLVRHLGGEIDIPSKKLLDFETFEKGSIIDMNIKEDS